MKEEIKRQRELTVLRGWLEGLKDVKKVNGTRNFNDVVNAVCKFTGKKRPTMMNQWYKGVQVKQYFIGKTIKNKLYIYLRADDNGSQLEQRISQLENNLIKTYANYSNDTKKGYYEYFTEHTGFGINKEILNKARKEVKEMKERKNESQSNIAKKCDELKAFLLSKNEQYGDSALTPIRIFSKSDDKEQLKVRIDDKLNRLLQGNANIEKDEDVIKDLIGYLILLLISMES